MPVVDWKKLLVTYIEHVEFCEGTDFMPHEPEGFSLEELAVFYEAFAEVAAIGGESEYASRRAATAAEYRAKANRQSEALSDLAAMDGQLL